MGLPGAPHRSDRDHRSASQARRDAAARLSPGLRRREVRAEIGAALGAGEDARVILFGHVGDGNLHVNVIGPEPEDQRADGAVFRLVPPPPAARSAPSTGLGVAKLDFVASGPLGW